MKEKLLKKFEMIFGYGGNDVSAYFAPGRVNLIGEHTDYNGGHVFPCALTIGTYAIASKRDDKTVRFYSENFKEQGITEVDLDNIAYDKNDEWANYPKGIIWAFEDKGYKITSGFDILYFGNIPNASGLSSSASIEVVTSVAIKDIFQFDIDMINIALISQYAENKFIGVNCGILDQFAVAMGKKDYAMFLDTSNLKYEYAPIVLKNKKIIIINTNSKRKLGDSEYNQRRSECEKAVLDLQSIIDIKSLGELTREQFEEIKYNIKDPIRIKRAKHAVYENQRTIKAVEALANNNIELFGRLMIESHASLRDDYEVTGIQLDTIVEAALTQDGVLGVRMTGAGFGGCAVAIVNSDKVEDFIKNVGKEYEEKIGYAADFYVVESGDGANKL